MDNQQTKFCKHCGEKIPIDAIICTKCGRQVEEIKKNGNNQIIITMLLQVLVRAPVLLPLLFPDLVS